MFLDHGQCDGIQDRSVFLEKGFVKIEQSCGKFWIKSSFIRFVGPAGLQVDATARAVDLDFPLCAAANCTNLSVFCGAEPPGGPIRAQ